jgi:hypothetical protein
MHTSHWFLQPLYRTYAAFRDAVDAAWHVVLDAEHMTRANLTPADVSLWHRWQTSLPVKTIEGERTCYVWRRRAEGGKWEYRSREMTDEEREERAEL